MSAVVTKQTWRDVRLESAMRSKAVMSVADLNSKAVPGAEVNTTGTASHQRRALGMKQCDGTGYGNAP
jgi:hypothetical protein